MYSVDVWEIPGFFSDSDYSAISEESLPTSSSNYPSSLSSAEFSEGSPPPSVTIIGVDKENQPQTGQELKPQKVKLISRPFLVFSLTIPVQSREEATANDEEQRICQ